MRDERIEPGQSGFSAPAWHLPAAFHTRHYGVSSVLKLTKVGHTDIYGFYVVARVRTIIQSQNIIKNQEKPGR